MKKYNAVSSSDVQILENENHQNFCFSTEERAKTSSLFGLFQKPTVT